MDKKIEGPGAMMVGNPLTLENLLKYLKDQTSYEGGLIREEMEILQQLKRLETNGTDLPQMIKNSIVTGKQKCRENIDAYKGYLTKSISIMLSKYFARLIVDELALQARVIRFTDLN